jgi:hypothetical protein
VSSSSTSAGSISIASALNPILSRKRLKFIRTGQTLSLSSNKVSIASGLRLDAMLMLPALNAGKGVEGVEGEKEADDRNSGDGDGEVVHQWV